MGIDVFDPPTEDEPTIQAGEDEAAVQVAAKVAALLERPAARTFA
ncbi:hypothetical protein [Streptomyces sp. NPDC088748]